MNFFLHFHDFKILVPHCSFFQTPWHSFRDVETPSPQSVGAWKFHVTVKGHLGPFLTAPPLFLLASCLALHTKAVISEPSSSDAKVSLANWLQASERHDLHYFPHMNYCTFIFLCHVLYLSLSSVRSFRSSSLTMRHLSKIVKIIFISWKSGPLTACSLQDNRSMSNKTKNAQFLAVELKTLSLVDKPKRPCLSLTREKISLIHTNQNRSHTC